MIRLIRFLITGDWRLPDPPHRHTWEETHRVREWATPEEIGLPSRVKLVLRCTQCGDVKSVPL